MRSNQVYGGGIDGYGSSAKLWRATMNTSVVVPRKWFGIVQALWLLVGGIAGFVIGNAANIGILFTFLTNEPTLRHYLQRTEICNSRKFCTDGLEFVVKLRDREAQDAAYIADAGSVTLPVGTTCSDLDGRRWLQSWTGGYSGYTSHIVDRSSEIGTGLSDNSGSIDWLEKGVRVSLFRTSENGVNTAYVKLSCI
jgi:hypothetical protein